jgi:hypothetical protein
LPHLLTFWQIGTDLGLMNAPVPLTSLVLAPGERADVLGFSTVILVARQGHRHEQRQHALPQRPAAGGRHHRPGDGLQRHQALGFFGFSLSILTGAAIPPTCARCMARCPAPVTNRCAS